MLHFGNLHECLFTKAAGFKIVAQRVDKVWMAALHETKDAVQLIAGIRYRGELKVCKVDVSTFVRLDDQLAGALRATQASAQPHGRFDQIADNW